MPTWHCVANNRLGADHQRGDKNKTSQICCGSCPVPAFIQCKMTTAEEKATLTEQPVFHEKAIGTEVVMTDAACDPQQPVTVETGTAMEEGDYPGEVWPANIIMFISIRRYVFREMCGRYIFKWGVLWQNSPYKP